MEEENNVSKTILGFVMLRDELSFNVNDLLNDLNKNYNLQIGEVTGASDAMVVRIDGELVGITHITLPIPDEDIEYTARYAYNWQTAIEDLKFHKTHLIVNIFNKGQDPIKCYTIFTRVICALLRTTNAIGVYKGNQCMLMPKEQYLNIADKMDSDNLPLFLWVHFGLIEGEEGNSGYTYGLKEFSKMEIEVLDSVNSIDDVQSFLYATAHYVIVNDITFKAGQTIGSTDNEKIAISFSEGVYVDGDTFKFAY